MAKDINLEAIKRAMNHPYKLGAGAKKRKKLKPSEKFMAVMKEWKRGTLMAGGGDNVKDQKQALAIAFSESGKGKKKRGKK